MLVVNVNVNHRGNGVPLPVVVNGVIFFKKSAADYGTCKACLSSVKGFSFLGIVGSSAGISWNLGYLLRFYPCRAGRGHSD